MNSNDNHYVKAMAQLEQHFGQKVSVLKAHKKRILSGSQIRNNLNDFPKIHTKLECFKEVIKFYKDEGSHSSGDLVNSIFKVAVSRLETGNISLTI